MGKMDRPAELFLHNQYVVSLLSFVPLLTNIRHSPHSRRTLYTCVSTYAMTRDLDLGSADRVHDAPTRVHAHLPQRPCELPSRCPPRCVTANSPRSLLIVLAARAAAAATVRSPISTAHIPSGMLRQWMVCDPCGLGLPRAHLRRWWRWPASNPLIGAGSVKTTAEACSRMHATALKRCDIHHERGITR